MSRIEHRLNEFNSRTCFFNHKRKRKRKGEGETVNKKREIEKIKEAKKNGQIYISPLIFGDSAVVLQKILTETIKKRRSK